MIGDKKTPRLVLESAYIKAVAGILTEIFHQQTSHAEQEVAAWWSRLAPTRAAKSGAFLHDDPLRTASEIQGVPEPELKEHEQMVYRTILKKSLTEARAQAQMQTSRQRVPLKQPVQVARLSKPQPALTMKRLTAGAGR